MEKLRVLLADDHVIVRGGIKLLIDTQPDMQVVGEAGDGEEACRLTRELQPDIVLMDVSMPLLGGAQATERIKITNPQVRVLALSAYSDDAHVRQLLSSQASGYVLKKSIAEELTNAIRTVARGGVHLDPDIAGKVVGGYVNPATVESGDASLSAREKDVLLAVAWGYSNREIAAKLHLSVKSVENTKVRVMEKLSLSSRTEVVRYALQRGWMQDE